MPIGFRTGGLPSTLRRQSGCIESDCRFFQPKRPLGTSAYQGKLDDLVVMQFMSTFGLANTFRYNKGRPKGAA